MYNCMKSEKIPMYHYVDPFAGIKAEWDHSNFELDLIIQFNWINEYIGKILRDGVSKEEIKRIYANVLKMLRTEHPNAKIMMVTRNDRPEFIKILRLY